MTDIVSLIKSKNPEDVTDEEFDAFQSAIEEAQNYLYKLQEIHRSLTDWKELYITYKAWK